MKNEFNRTSMVLSAVLVIVLIGTGVFFFSGKNLKKLLNAEKIRSENLLSEKMQLDKSLKQYMEEVNSLKGKNEKLDKMINDANEEIEKKNAGIRKLMANNAGLATLKKKIADLEKTKESLQNEIKTMAASIQALQDDNADLETMLKKMENENQILATNNTILRAMAADNYRIEALKGKNEKLTVNARRTNKIFISFDVPSDVAKDIYFKIQTPEGNEFNSTTDASAQVKVKALPELSASLSQAGIAKEDVKRVELEFLPEEKLSRGIYRFDVYNESHYVGRTQLRLK